MISVHISGGLGNQLFQYAAGLALARRLNTKLRLDARKFSNMPAQIEDPAARSNIGWMLLGGTVISFLVAPGLQEKPGRRGS